MTNTTMTMTTMMNTIEGGVNMTNALTTVSRLESLIKEVKVNKSASMVSITSAVKVIKKFNLGLADEEELVMAMACINMSKSGAKINDPKVLRNFYKTMKAKEGYISLAEVEIARNSWNDVRVGKMSINTSPMSRALAHCITESDIVVPIGNAGHTNISENSFAPFSKSIISIRFTSDKDLEIARDKGIYVMFAGRKTHSFSYHEITNKWESINSKVEYTIEELKEHAKSLDADLRLYKCSIFGPSDVRKHSFAGYDVTVVDNRDEILDNASNGAWTKAKKLIEDYRATGASPEQVQKMILKTAPRFGQLKAGSTNLGKIESWLYYKEKFQTYSGHTIDGTAYLKASYVARLFSNVLGVNVTPNAVAGMFLQARPDMQKGAYLVVNDASFSLLVSIFTEKGAERIGSRKNEIEPVLLVDKNLVKLESNYDVNDICLELLEIADSSAANYSGQAHEKVLCSDFQRAQELVSVLSEDHICNLFERILEPRTSLPTPGTIAKGYVADIVSSIACHKIAETPALMRTELKNASQSAMNATNKIKFSIEGANARLIADYSELIVGEGRENAIIKYGEVWMPHAATFFTKKYRKEAIAICKEKGMSMEDSKKFIIEYIDNKMKSTNVCMIKYPSMGIKEYYLARPLTLKEIYARIKLLNTTDVIKRALAEMYKEQTDGVSMLPSLSLNMFQCAGLDYDYDGGVFFYNEEYCDILSHDIQEATSF